MGPSAPASPMRPMLAVAGEVPGGAGWAFEFSWGGARTLADVRPGRVRLAGDADRGPVAGYPELDELATLLGRRRVLLDGAVVALDARGLPSRSRLQRRAAVPCPSADLRRRVPVAYYVFDLLRLDDQPTVDLPYHRRRALLAELGLGGGTVALAPSFTGTDGQAVLETAAQYGLPGVVAKRADSRYRPGRRSRSWVQTALRPTQEVVVGGWVPGTDGATVRSLLVGIPTEHGPRYVGQVTTGFTAAGRRDLGTRLCGLERRDSPFVGQPLPVDARWAAPELLGEVAYRHWTPHAHLAQPTWRGLRPGRHPAAVRAPVLLTGAADDAERAELDEAVRRARGEMDALRAQLAPHFLYNALSAIASVVHTDPSLAGDLLTDFADFTRYCLRSGVAFSTLDEELDTVERYLALEHARLGDRLRVDLRVAPELLPVVLPYLTLQLAVESAVRHGIEGLPGGGTLVVSAVRSGADCVVTVEDDGPGMSEERSAALRTVDDRLRDASGAGSGLAVQAGTSGTRVSFRLPAGG